MTTLVLLVLALAGCNSDEETEYAQYNADDDSVEVLVGTPCDPEPCAPVEVELHSNTGSELIGTASVDPGGGPIGTIHRVEVYVDEAYAEDIDRASVRTDSGDRGEDEFDLVKDSTGAGWFVYEIESVGEEGEVRTDTLTFRLWEEVETEDDEG